MGIINVLDPQLANLIAAGEVVERPASIVKELMENSIDARAKNITVEIKNGGISFIRISDDGLGMSKEDLPICIARHATSKIKRQEDLDGIITLGFRGEALAAISSVSIMKIFTKRQEDSHGHMLEAVNGEVVNFSEIGSKNGTTIIVEELFANVPARLKFLKRDASETLAVTAAVEKIALSHPEIAVNFIVNGAVRFTTSGDGILKSAIYAVLGRTFASKLVPVSDKINNIQVGGFIGTPENIRANRNYQNFFINGRYVKSRTVMAALEQAFSSYIPVGKFPSCVLTVEIHPAMVDVNVHPAKLEVKFSNEQFVFDAVYGAVRTTLQQMQYHPIAESKNKGSGMLPLSSNSIAHSKTVEPLISHLSPQKNPLNANRYTLAEDTNNKQQKFEDIPPHLMVQSQKPKPVPHENIQNLPPKTPPVYGKPLNNVASPTENKTPNQALKESPESPSTPPQKKIIFHVLCEIFNCYIMIEHEGKLLMIDKHAAHERILFEEMRENIKGKAISQMLLMPLEITLTNMEIDAAYTYKIELNALGFDYTIVEKTKKMTVSAIPSNLTAEQAEEMIISALGGLADGTASAESSREKYFEQALYQASCKAAIKAGRVYDRKHIEWICEQVLSNSRIKFCPHGRPVAFEMTQKQLENLFKRT